MARIISGSEISAVTGSQCHEIESARILSIKLSIQKTGCYCLNNAVLMNIFGTPLWNFAIYFRRPLLFHGPQFLN